jgi:prevent-host-death family protein
MDMEKAVSAAEANRKFSQLLQGVRLGRSYVVTSHGKPVAKISPVNENEWENDKVAASAREALLARLRRQPAVKIDRWTRDELYEDAH